MDKADDEKAGSTATENKPSVTLSGMVQKIIKPNTDEPEKAEIAVEGADDLYKEIRVENTLQNGEGKEVKLKPGAEVAVTIEADAAATTPKSESEHRSEKSVGENRR